MKRRDGFAAQRGSSDALLWKWMVVWGFVGSEIERSDVRFSCTCVLVWFVCCFCLVIECVVYFWVCLDELKLRVKPNDLFFWGSLSFKSSTFGADEMSKDVILGGIQTGPRSV